jgi:PASTA domain-containing protein
MRRVRILAVGALASLIVVGLARADQQPGATYKGKTALDGDVWLVVSPDGSSVTKFIVSSYNGGCGQTATFGGTIAIDRVRNTFSIDPYGDGWAVVNGSFTTDAMAEGSVHIANSCGADTTWTAEVTDNPAPPPPGGPPIRCSVPKVIGMRLERARAQIKSNHCSFGKVRYVRSRRPRGHVISQRPPARTIGSRSTRVDLTISHGARPK